MNDAIEFYIVNEVDRPYGTHVCQKMDADGHLEYISEHLRDWHIRNGQMKITDEATNMKLFGFDGNIEDGLAHFEKVRQSMAKYSDGRHRAWQGEHAFDLVLK